MSHESVLNNKLNGAKGHMAGRPASPSGSKGIGGSMRPLIDSSGHNLGKHASFKPIVHADSRITAKVGKIFK